MRSRSFQHFHAIIRRLAAAPWRRNRCQGAAANHGLKAGVAIIATALVASASAQSTTSTAVDLSSPKSAVASMFAAVNDADPTALKQVFESTTSQATELTGAYTDLIVAGQKLREAARLKFANDTPNPAKTRDGTTPGQPTPEQAAQLGAADVKIDGDSATVSLHDRRVPIQLHHAAGHWRIDMSAFASGTDAQLAAQAEVDRSLAAAMQETADEITAGKYASAQEAESAVQQKVHAVIAGPLKAMAATQASTHPSTQQ